MAINTIVGHTQRISGHKSRSRWNWWTYRLSGDRGTHHGHPEIGGDHQLIVDLEIGPVEWSDHTHHLKYTHTQHKVVGTG